MPHWHQHKGEGMLLFKKGPVNPFTKLRHNHFHKPSDRLPSLPPSHQPSLVTLLHPGAQTHGDTTGTHSFGLGLVGSGRPSFPGDGDSFPGDWGEPGATWDGLWAVAVTSVIRSDCGRGGGGGVVTLGRLGGDGGFVSWPFCTDPFPWTLSSPSEPICTGGRDDTLGQISSSLTWKASVPGWGSTLGGSSRRLISVGGGGEGKAVASSNPELSPDTPLLESSAADGNK